MIAGQAQSLSCMRPEPIATFQQLADAPESYFVLYERLSFDDGKLPTGVSLDQTRKADPIPARFEGKALSSGGFTIDYAHEAVLEIGCAGPWCGSAKSGVDALFFVVASGPPVTILAEPCGGRIFEEPTQEVIDMLTTCMQGGVCSPQPLQ